MAPLTSDGMKKRFDNFSNPFLSKFDKIILDLIEQFGGFVDTHTHLDRADTIGFKYLSHTGVDPIEAGATLTLKAKQNLTGYLHEGIAYEEENLYERIKAHLERLIKMNTREVTSFIDATPDIGLRAINIAFRLKNEFKERINFKIAVSPIFGFKNPEINSDRWSIYEEAAKITDVLGGLPEKDDAPDRIGFNEHIKKILKLANDLGKEAHFQLDQANDPKENGAETLIEAVRWLGSPKVKGLSANNPTVWVIHALSPSCYPEKRFRKLIENLVEYNIGVICCPIAALSMRQNRNVKTPTHNSIARVLEMAEAGVRIKLGSDNVCDVFIPSGRGSILDEIFALSNAVRFYNPTILAKFATGKELNEIDKDRIRKVLAI